jgi:adenylate cyclase
MLKIEPRDARSVFVHIYLRGNHLQRLRLASGLFLFAFAAAHFLNHALGLIGFETMHQVQLWRIAVTRSWPGTIILIAALVVHITLALYKLARRKTWRMPRWEAVQIGLGVAIPFLPFPHIVNTRIAHVFFGGHGGVCYPRQAQRLSRTGLGRWGLRLFCRVRSRTRGTGQARGVASCAAGGVRWATVSSQGGFQ